MKKIWYITVNVGLPLFVGLLCYLLLRPDAFVAKIFYRCTGKINQFSINNNLFLIVIDNHLADFLWALSMSHMLFAYGCYIEWDKRTLTVTCMFTCVMMEILIGVFDPLDILVEWIAVILVFYKYNSIKNIWRR